MYKSRRALVLASCLLVAIGFLLVLLLPIAHASDQMSPQNSGAGDGAVSPVMEDVEASAVKRQAASEPALAPAAVSTTTLDVAIHSSPLAVRDNNNLTVGPRVFVVHAVVTNTGTVTATDLLVSLDYQEDPANDWILVPGENPERMQDKLAPGAVRHSYWFASYPAGLDLGHQYQVTASAANAAAVSTTDNVFGNPAPGATVQTASFQDTGNNGQVALSADIVVGVAFSMTVDYDLGSNAAGLIFSPIGNLDFDPGSVELRAVSVRFHDLAETQETTVADQLFFPTVPALPDNTTPGYAEVTYTFLSLRAGTNNLCPYTGIDYGTTQKYDNDYCQGDRQAVLTGTLTFDFVKEVSDLQVQESERLTYTLHYTNTGTLPLVYTWIWDEVDPQVGRILTSTVSPAPDATESSEYLVAWNLGTVPPAGQPDSSGTVTFSIVVDAPADEDLPDGQTVVNNAFFGINEGTLPPSAAVTETVTSTVRAPTIVAAKTDGLTTVQDGQPLTYTVTISNEGSVAAVGLSASDVLPDEVQLAGAPSPPATEQSGQTLSWDSLDDLNPGTMMTITIPVSVTAGTPSFTRLLNEFLLNYTNPAGHQYQTKQVSDTTTVVRQAAFVQGHVFDDTNGDGIFDDTTESGLEGVELSLPGAYTPTVSTDSAGFYRFRIESSGVYSVTETDPPDYVSTTPNRVAVDVVLGETYTVTFGDRPVDGSSAAIHGTVFSDDDGDGVWDGGEAGIPGVTVTLDGALTTATDVNGSYTFGAVAPGLHTVEETDPPGYVSTTPNLVAVDAVADNSYAVNFGDMPPGSGSAAIHGTVFSDDDGNGVWDTGEAGIPGVTVTLDATQTTATDAYGSYSFGAVAPGQHTVEETDLPGYVSTTPNRVTLNTVAEESYPVDFGDRPVDGSSAAIFGSVFSDDDGDGLWDGGEAGIPGVTVTLDGAQMTTTDANGSYTFGSVAPGLHTVEETDPPGYVSTTPNLVAVDAVADEGYEVNFGDMPVGSGAAAIHGTVFSDDDGDGLWDTGEAGIPGVTVTLDFTQTTATDAYGSYSFGAVAPGQHTVEETDLPGYLSTTPNRVTLNTVAEESYPVDFGDRPVGSGAGAIHGTVFSDVDGDGIWDGDESGIPGVTVTLDSAETTTTDANGSYTFGAVAPGQHTVEETDLPGYLSTTPNSVTETVEAETTYTVNFGDVLLGIGSCSPDGYEDDDSPAQATPLGAGVVADHDFCDADAADWHTFEVERGDVYTITTAALGQRADTILTLFDTDGQTVLAANDDYAGTTNFSSQIVWRASASGTYFIRITNRAGLAEWLTGYDVWFERQDNHYLWLPLVSVPATVSSARAERQSPTGFSGRLSLRNSPQSPSGVIDHCDPDAFEVDDTWEQARPVMNGMPQTHTFDSDTDLYAADKDFVVFEIGPEGALSVTSNSTTTSTLLELYDAEGQALNRSGVDELVWSDPPMGRYYLSVTPVSAAYSCDGSVSYELTVDYTPLYRLLLPVVRNP